MTDSDNVTFTITEDFFNVIELHEAQCIVGVDLLLGGRCIERRRDGTVVRDETTWHCRLVGGAPHYTRATTSSQWSAEEKT